MANNDRRGTVGAPAPGAVRDEAGSVPARWRGDPLWSLAAAHGLSPAEILDVLAGLDRWDESDDDDYEELCLAGSCAHQPGDPWCGALDFFDEDDDDGSGWLGPPPEPGPLLTAVRAAGATRRHPR